MGQDGMGAITRRTLLGGAAAAGAASLLTPTGALGSIGGPRSAVTDRWLGTLLGESQPLAAPTQFSLVGIEWSARSTARIELRTQAADGRWSRWVTASVLGHDGDRRVRGASLFGEPVWSGPAERVQLRSDGLVTGVRVHFVTPRGGGIGAGLAAAPALASPVLDAGPGQPPILARGAWAAGRAHPTHIPEYGTIKCAFIHHTESPNGYARGEVPSLLRGIFDYHVYVRGFWDIAYNFLIDAYGRIWEGRAGGIDMAVMGAHAGGYNLESTGVAVIGSFMNVAPPAATIHALKQLLAWKLSLHGIPSYGRVTVVVDPSGAVYTPFAPGAHVSLPRVAGHRDGDSTSCPGDAFYHRLPGIRPHVTALAGTPAQLTITPPSPVAPSSAVTLSGQLALLTGSPLAGATIELQQLGPKGPPAVVIATATTAADGSWSASLTASTRNMVVRALHPDYPATVADWVLIPVAPTITLQQQASPPLTVSGTISPVAGKVRVFVYSGTSPSGAPITRKRVHVSQGQFTVQFPTVGPGTYTVVARSKGTSGNAPGVSAPLTVTVT
jgi:hypothetical protein